MTQSMFVKKDIPDILEPKGKKNYKGYKGIVKNESEGSDSDYISGESVHGITGTKVPLSSRTGGIEGSRSAYGAVVKGKVMSGEGLNPVGEIAIKESPMTDRKSRSVKKAPDKVEKAIDELLDDEVPAPAKRSRAKSKAKAEVNSPAVSNKYKRATLEGVFGTYKGKYVDVFRDGNVLVLMYSLDDAAFCPPADPDHPIQVSCDGISYEVYYFGIDFAVESINMGMQIMLFNDSESE